ncbi:MAG: hypothetical protein IJ109_03990 [Firmicutes bacterium]|nr:hypothetical protein [Bacillota bacterium]
MKNKLVFIGNSIVNGFPMSRGRSFPGLIRAAIKAGETSFHADVINKGANGETTADILGRFEHDVLDHEPRAVFIMTGTNDFIYREAGPAGCMENLQRMAALARGEAAGEDAPCAGDDRVKSACALGGPAESAAPGEPGILPVFLTPIAVDAEKAGRMWMAGLGIDYEEINRQIGEFSEMIRGSGEWYIDTGAAWKEFTEAPAEEPLGGGAYLDGVHPTPEGYRFLADVVLKWLEEHAGQLGLR